MGSSRVVGFTRVRPWGRWVHQGSLNSLRYSLGVVEFNRCIWFTKVRAGVVGFIRSIEFALGVVGFIGGRFANSGSRWWSLGSSWVVGFTRVRAGVGWVHPGSFFHSGSRWVSLGLLGFAQGAVALALEVDWIIRCRLVNRVSPWGSLGSSGVFGFTRIRPGGRWVHPGSLDSLGFALGVLAFIRGCWVQSGSRLGSLCSLGVVGFTRVPLVVRFIGVRVGSLGCT